MKLLRIYVNFIIMILYLFLSYSNANSNSPEVNNKSYDLSDTDYATIFQMVPNATKSGMYLYFNNKSCDMKFFKYEELYIYIYDNFDTKSLLICAEPFINDNWFVGRGHKIWGNNVLAFDSGFKNYSIESLEKLNRILLSAGVKTLDKKNIKAKGNFNFAIGRCERLSKNSDTISKINN